MSPTARDSFPDEEDFVPPVQTGSPPPKRAKTSKAAGKRAKGKAPDPPPQSASQESDGEGTGAIKPVEVTAMGIDQEASKFLLSVIVGYVEWNTENIPQLRAVNTRPEDPKHTSDIAVDLEKRDRRFNSPLFLLADKSDFVTEELPAERQEFAPRISKSFDEMKDVKKVIVAAGQHRILANNLYVKKLMGGADAEMDVDVPGTGTTAKGQLKDLAEEKRWWPATIYDISTVYSLPWMLDLSVSP
jgi:hypothetical protein